MKNAIKNKDNKKILVSSDDKHKQAFERFIRTGNKDAREKNESVDVFIKKICNFENKNKLRKEYYINKDGGMNEPPDVSSLTKELYDFKVELLESAKYFNEKLKYLVEEDLEIENMILSSNHSYERLKFIEEDVTIKEVFLNIRDRISDLLIPVEIKKVRLNDLGLPMHPLEIEVAEMLDKVRHGEAPFNNYKDYQTAKRDNSSIKNPKDYLYEYYKSYLKIYNGEADYMYQADLRNIDPLFCDNLRKWFSGKGDSINNYIPNRTVKLNNELDVVIKNGLKKQKSNKINSLKSNRAL
jgi:hypothetical protein